MIKNDNYLDNSIMRLLINPSLDDNMFERIITTLDKKSTSDKKKLLSILKKHMENFKESARDFSSPRFYEMMCDKIRNKIKVCENYFPVTLSDILSLTENTSIRFADVGWEYLSPQAIADMIEEDVVGQKEYSQALALCAYLHMIRCRNHKGNYPKMNMLVYGPTGVGKTFGVQVLARKLNIDFEIVNSNMLVPQGIQGENFTDALTRAYIKNKNLKDLILFLDEFDKRYKESHFSEAILMEFLSLLDDNGEVTFRSSFGYGAKQLKIPTRNITIILGGVFDTLEAIVNKRMGGCKVGFTSTQAVTTENFYQYVTKEDFSKLFHSDELLGRIGQFVRMENMTREMLLEILFNEYSSPLVQYRNYFDLHDCSIQLTKEGAEQIVEVVEKQHLGVRGLKSVLGKVLKEEMMKAGTCPSHTIVIDKRYVLSQLHMYSESEQLSLPFSY